MTRRIGGDESGTSAIEFALLAPVFLLLAWGAFGLALALWTKSALQETAAETARCLAIGASTCAAADATCAATAGECFFTRLAARRGIGDVLAGQITVNRTALVGGVSFTTVTVTYPYSVLGNPIPLTLTGHFPNPI
ncbi:TadE family protein [Methylobacterium sp. 77]|uniref:TadE/TadG family type IV pilus assembly protein n=1 Tax=Methylobacterium sp. 77 TaxID=1101192 RepID=UPI0003675CAC|nr:TadE family protein [Methylobacterium sp. 77]